MKKILVTVVIILALLTACSGPTRHSGMVTAVKHSMDGTGAIVQTEIVFEDGEKMHFDEHVQVKPGNIYLIFEAEDGHPVVIRWVEEYDGD